MGLYKTYKRKCRARRSGKNKGVCVYSPSWTSWRAEGHGRFLKRVQVRQRVHVLISGGSYKCGVPVCQACKHCMFAGSTKLDWLASRGPTGQVRGIWAGVPAGQRGCASACACEPSECLVHAVTSELRHW